MKKFAVSALAAVCFALPAAPALAVETITVGFTQPTGGVTTGLYSGRVRVRASGTGFSNGTLLNDAFYQLPDGFNPGSFYQLTFDTQPLVRNNPARNAANFVEGGRPAFNPANVYTFFLNTGTTTPSRLYFGVSDDIFEDNGGSFTLSIGGVPEPATWAMMILGFGVVGGAMRVRRRQSRLRSV
jgi:hypothetical protein